MCAVLSWAELRERKTAPPSCPPSLVWACNDDARGPIQRLSMSNATAIMHLPRRAVVYSTCATEAIERAYHKPLARARALLSANNHPAVLYMSYNGLRALQNSKSQSHTYVHYLIVCCSRCCYKALCVAKATASDIFENGEIYGILWIFNILI